MTVGLTLGKFAPLHRGHQHLIETALAETDHVIVLIYHCPETTSCPLPVRANWIRTLYPQVEVIEAWDGPMEVGNTPEIRRMHEDYLRSILRDRPITHFYSSEFYGDHVSKALGAVDRRIDSARTRFPVSGTVIRADAFSHREYLAPVVYRDLITNIVFLGAPSTGKTTLAQTLANEWQTVWMPEYGREYWEEHETERRLTLGQLVEIAEGHLQREETLLGQANRCLFTDTNAITTYMFSMYYHGKADPRLKQLAEEAKDRYDLVFLCGDDIPYDDTWDRSGEANRREFQQRIRDDLEERQIPHVTLYGSLQDRVFSVRKTLLPFDKFAPI